MNIYKKFINYAIDLADNKNVISIYKKLVPVFKKAGLYIQEAGILEKIYNINKDSSLYKTIGDIYLEKIGNYNIAQIAYNNYFKEKNPEFFEKYTKAFDIEVGEDEDLDNNALLISDRYNCICYMIVYCCQRKEYDCIIKFKKYLQSVKKELVNHIKKNKLNPEEYFKDINIINEYISSKFSELKHNNNINKFAIELNPKNEMAYINILDNYIEHKNYENALKFYNNEYKKAFDLQEKHSIVDICWEISDKYRDYGDIFSAVKRQQDAVNIELGV